jgi:hypothetical protein
MVRIRGQIGPWPVDVTVELDAQDWAQLAQHTPPAVPPVASDALWQTTLELLRQTGQIEGPQLLAQLAGLAGGGGSGQAPAGAPIYHWVG